MNVRRSSHGCSIVHLGTQKYGVVSGGYHHRYLHSTEWIDLDQESPRWTEGMQVKSKMVYLKLNSSFS